MVSYGILLDGCFHCDIQCHQRYITLIAGYYYTWTALARAVGDIHVFQARCNTFDENDVISDTQKCISLIVVVAVVVVVVLTVCCAVAAQLLWLEMTLFSKKTSHKIEKH